MEFKKLLVHLEDGSSRYKFIVTGDFIPNNIVVLMAGEIQREFPGIDLETVQVITATDFKEISFEYAGDIPNCYEVVIEERLKCAPLL